MGQTQIANDAQIGRDRADPVSQNDASQPIPRDRPKFELPRRLDRQFAPERDISRKLLKCCEPKNDTCHAHKKKTNTTHSALRTRFELVQLHVLTVNFVSGYPHLYRFLVCVKG